MQYHLFSRFAPPFCLIRYTLLSAMAMVLLSSAGAGASELRWTPIVRAVKNAQPSVVNIHGRKTVRASGSPAEGSRPVNGMGTGVVIDQRGYIITNFHVVDGVSNIQVTLYDQRAAAARLVAHDPKTDLAIIKISDSYKLPVIKVGTSSDLMPGETVIAVGNAYGYENTVTRGIVSALHRTVPVNDNHKYLDLIQTDASINPGNSGGPLLNIDGEMIGINVAVRVGAQGIGFAIPVDNALDAASRLLSAERLGGVMHGVKGVTTGKKGVPSFIVQKVRSDSPAEKGGLKKGDSITAVEETKISRALDFERALLGRKVGEEVELKVKRDGKPVTISLVIASHNGTTDRSLAQRGWKTLGMRFESIPSQTFHRYKSRYRGGLKVVAVRAESPASEQGVQEGDILVGMHIWETISPENISYILNRSDFKKLQPVKFYILRNNETLYGHMTVQR